MYCAISGHVPQEPVLSIKSGHLFEKRLIEKEIDENGVCPITKESLSLDDLIPLNVNKIVKPRPSTATSIPGLLNLFHNEWDALMLECHSLRQSLQTARQELSHSLYQHDAACRVIARVIRERDEARKALEEYKKLENNRLTKSIESEKAEEMEKEALASDVVVVEGPENKKPKLGINDEIGETLLKLASERVNEKQKYIHTETLASIEDIQSYGLMTSQPLHKTKEGGILWLSTNPSYPEILATAGEDTTIQIFDRSEARILITLDDHLKKVNHLEWISNEVFASCSADRTVRVWVGQDTDWECGLILSNHDDDIVSVSRTASENYLITASKDSSLGFFDITKGECLEKLTDDNINCGFSCGEFHPDGVLYCSGAVDGSVLVWEMQNRKVIKLVDTDKNGKHDGPITGISFNNDCVTMATASPNTVKLWDLRKMEIFREIKPVEASSFLSVTFDSSGKYLAIGGDDDARIYSKEQKFCVIKSFTEIPGNVNCISIDVDAKSILVGSNDHNLRIFGPV